VGGKLMNWVTRGHMVDTKKRFLVRDAEIRARSREEGRS